jgi:hypothetical protein
MNYMKYTMALMLAAAFLSAGMAFAAGPMAETRFVGPANTMVETCAQMQTMSGKEASPMVETRFIGPANTIVVASAPARINPYKEAGPDVGSRFVGPANKIVRGESEVARDATGRVVTDAFCKPVVSLD